MKYQDNFNYVTTEVIPVLGFRGVVDNEIYSKMDQDLQKFSTDPVRASYENGKVDFRMNFEKIESTQKPGEFRYYLQSIDASFLKEGLEEPLQHTFTLFSQRGFNAKEMYNMMDGRFVYQEITKSGERIGRWATIDFNKVDENGNTMKKMYYDENINFRPVKELSYIPLIRMTPDEKEDLIKRVKSGDEIDTTITTAQGREKVTIYALPNMGYIPVFNQKGEELSFKKSNMQYMSETPKLSPVKEDPKKVSPEAKALLKKAEEKTSQGNKNDKKNSQKQTG